MYIWRSNGKHDDTVNGSNLAPAEIGRYAIIYKVLYISGGAGFLPSTVAPPGRHPKKETSLPTIHFQVQAVSFR